MKKTFKVFGSLLLATSLIFGVVSCDNASKGVDGTGVESGTGSCLACCTGNSLVHCYLNLNYIIVDACYALCCCISCSSLPTVIVQVETALV